MTEPNHPHIVWDGEGSWTDYPPPADFDGEEEGDYGNRDYRCTLSPAKQAVIDAERADDRAFAEEQRGRHFWPRSSSSMKRTWTDRALKLHRRRWHARHIACQRIAPAPTSPAKETPDENRDRAPDRLRADLAGRAVQRRLQHRRRR